MPRSKKTPPREERVLPSEVSHLLAREVGQEEGPLFAAIHDDNYKWLPDKTVDFVLTDPPFNIAQDTNFHTYEKNTIHSYRFDKDKGWDTYSDEAFIALLHSWAEEFARVLRVGGTFAVFCADEYVSHLMDALEANGLKNRRVITWRKPNAVPINRQSMMMSACEYIVMGVKGGKATFNSDLIPGTLDGSVVAEYLIADKVANVVETAVRDALHQLGQGNIDDTERVKKVVDTAINGSRTEAAKRVTKMFASDDSGQAYLRGCVPNIITHTSKGGNRLHPTEKPVAILAYLIALFSRPGDVVLDPFGGSGSTGEAALSMGRRAIIVERDDAYFSALSARLNALTN